MHKYDSGDKRSYKNERIPSGCRLLHASGMRLATTEPGGEKREQLRCEAIRRIRLLSMQSYDSGDKRSCKNELAHFCMRLGRPQTRGSSHFALFILDFANLSVQNERIPSGCRIARAAPLRSDP